MKKNYEEKSEDFSFFPFDDFMSDLKDTLEESMRDIKQSINAMMIDLKEEFSYLKDEVKDIFDSCESFEEGGIHD